MKSTIILVAMVAIIAIASATQAQVMVGWPNPSGYGQYYGYYQPSHQSYTYRYIDDGARHWARSYERASIVEAVSAAVVGLAGIAKMPSQQQYQQQQYRPRVQCPRTSNCVSCHGR